MEENVEYFEKEDEFDIIEEVKSEVFYKPKNLSILNGYIGAGSIISFKYYSRVLGAR